MAVVQKSGESSEVNVELGEAKIENFDGVFGDHQVFWLEVAMDNAGFVGPGKSFGNLHGDSDDFADGKITGGEKFAQGFSFDEFQNEEIDAVLVADVVKGADIWMREAGDGAGFVIQAFAEIGLLGEALGKDFDRDVAAEASIESAVNFAHATGAE